MAEVALFQHWSMLQSCLNYYRKWFQAVSEARNKNVKVDEEQEMFNLFLPPPPEYAWTLEKVHEGTVYAFFKLIPHGNTNL